MKPKISLHCWSEFAGEGLESQWVARLSMGVHEKVITGKLAGDDSESLSAHCLDAGIKALKTSCYIEVFQYPDDLKKRVREGIEPEGHDFQWYWLRDDSPEIDDLKGRLSAG